MISILFAAAAWSSADFERLSDLPEFNAFVQCTQNRAELWSVGPDPANVIADAVLSSCNPEELALAKAIVTIKADADGPAMDVLRAMAREQIILHIVRSRAERNISH